MILYVLQFTDPIACSIGTSDLQISYQLICQVIALQLFNFLRHQTATNGTSWCHPLIFDPLRDAFATKSMLALSHDGVDKHILTYGAKKLLINSCRTHEISLNVHTYLRLLHDLSFLLFLSFLSFISPLLVPLFVFRSHSLKVLSLLFYKSHLPHLFLL